MKKLLIIACSVILILVSFQTFSPTQAQVSVDSRIDRLESDLVGIRSQLNQLSGSRPSAGVNVPTPSRPTGSRRTAYIPNSQFDQLATLVVELKERVNNLEAKVGRLERPAR
jgi:hypothetical protein